MHQGKNFLLTNIHEDLRIILLRAILSCSPLQKIQKTEQSCKEKRMKKYKKIYELSAFVMMDNLVGLRSNPSRRRCWCDEGLIKLVRAFFTSSPSTPPILTREFFIADLRRLSVLLPLDEWHVTVWFF